VNEVAGLSDTGLFMLASPWGLLLAAIAMVFVGLPLLRRSYREEPADTASINTEFYRQQVQSLEQQRDNGELSEEQFETLCAEQQRLLLADTQSTSRQQKGRSGGGWLLITVLVLVPVLALQLYQRLGAADDLEITRLLEQRAVTMEPAQRAAQREVLIKKVGQRLTQQPEHIGYRVTQARLLTEHGLFDEGIVHYREAMNQLPDDTSLVAEYAQAAYFAAGNQFTPNVQAAVDKVLAVDPANITVLGLQGIRAFSDGDYSLAIQSWQQALSGTAPGTPQAAALRSGIDEAKSRLGEPLPGLAFRVEMAPGLAANPASTVFVYAVEADASPMPLAIARLQVADLPADVRLDDSMAMPGGKPLSSVDEIQLVARISVSGNAAPAAGDLEGRSDVISQGEVADSSEITTHLLIDNILK
jgi:cytochrome c-type biogenesis protein CcmH